VGPNDPFMKMPLMQRQKAAETWISGSKLSDPAVRQKLIEGGEAAVRLDRSDDCPAAAARSSAAGNDQCGVKTM